MYQRASSIGSPETAIHTRERAQRLACLVTIVALQIGSSARAQDVPYEKYVLPNGMTVILHEDHSLPIASVNIWYHVGSKDEVRGRSGFAHLFEHLMFMGTERVPGSDFDNLMEAGGGANNATTSEDRTNYFESGPAALLPTLLWLEADRLEDLGRTMTQEKLDKQRDVVRNERRQSYENRPYGKSELRIQELMYPDGHPYHIPVIGTHEDLEAAQVSDVTSFFATYYVPCNASMVVAGDFSPGEIKPLIDRLFGTLPRGAEPVHRKADPVKLSGVVRSTMSDTVQFARTTVVFHSPAAYAPGDAEMRLAGAILGDGISSRLYQKLVYEKPLAVEVGASQEPTLLGSLFYVSATAKPGVELSEIEAAIDVVIKEFAANGPKAEELERQKAGIEYAALSSLQSIMAKADRLNAYQFHYGEPNSFKRDLDRYRGATVESVRDWAKKVLTLDARLILRVLPEVPTASPDPRDSRPGPAGERPFEPPPPATFKLGNGITVHHWARKELPLINLVIQLKGGSALDGSAQSGLASLAAEMLDEGAGDRGAVAFADALDVLGANFRAACDHESTQASLSVLGKNFDKALALFADAVQRPRFDPQEWNRVQDLHVEELKQERDDPTAVSGVVGMRAFFGTEHPYGRPIDGTPETVAGLQRDQAVAFHARQYSPSNATILAAGDMNPEQLKQHLETAFGGWRDAAASTADARPATAAPAAQALRVVLVDKPEAVQTVIRFYMPAPPYGDPRRTKLELLSIILGGSFTSRLNQNLREEHGYTYGARAGYTLNPSVGYMTAGANVRADVTGASLREFLKEFAGIRSGNVSERESTKARSTYRANMVQSFASLGGVLAEAGTLVQNGRPFSDWAADLKAAEAVAEADLNVVAKEAIPLEQGLLVLVGDKGLVLKQLEGLELPTPVEFTVSGEPKPSG